MTLHPQFKINESYLILNSRLRTSNSTITNRIHCIFLISAHFLISWISSHISNGEEEDGLGEMKMEMRNHWRTQFKAGLPILGTDSGPKAQTLPNSLILISNLNEATRLPRSGRVQNYSILLDLSAALLVITMVSTVGAHHVCVVLRQTLVE